MAKPAIILALFCAVYSLYSQEIDQEILGIVVPAEGADTRDRLRLSISQENYPVTPGDVYSLTYRAGGQEISSEILVESNYILNLHIFGRVNAAGVTLSELKAQVENIISKAYPNSLPYLTIISVGIFQVLIKGEVQRAQFVTTWGLSRLSETIEDYLEPYSSTRVVGIISRDGSLNKYDVFKALNLGIIEEDPFIKPGDTIVIYRRDKEVEISGEIYRPGKYQLLQNEGLKELVDTYGGGITPLADLSRIKIERSADEEPITLYVDLTEEHEDTEVLKDGDIVNIPSKSANPHVVIFEGALAPELPVTPGDIEAPEAYTRITHPFKLGETLYDALKSIEQSISPLADLSHAYILRQNVSQPIYVNLLEMLYTYPPKNDVILQPFDRIILPSQRYYVSVGGAVASPGNYLYASQRRYSYYVSLAGGIDPERNADNKVTISDSEGNQRTPDEIIQPGDRIFVNINNFAYSFNRWFPVITTGIAFIATIITIVNLLAD